MPPACAARSRAPLTALHNRLCPSQLENLGLSPETVAALHAKGIKAMFPIQKSVFEPIAQGRDVTARARTGSGKTMAFALPVVESLLAENKAAGGSRPARGRMPRAIVLAPTRELANQVAREFESACPTLKVVPVYGGVSMGPQCRCGVRRAMPGGSAAAFCAAGPCWLAAAGSCPAQRSRATVPPLAALRHHRLPWRTARSSGLWMCPLVPLACT